MDNDTNSWSTVLYSTLNSHHISVEIDESKADELRPGLDAGLSYLFTLSSGFEMEVVRVVASCQGILTLERGQQGTMVGIWPAGTVLEGRIPAYALEDLQLDASALLAGGMDVMLAPNGDLITKV